MVASKTSYGSVRHAYMPAYKPLRYAFTAVPVLLYVGMVDDDSLCHYITAAASFIIACLMPTRLIAYLFCHLYITCIPRPVVAAFILLLPATLLPAVVSSLLFADALF